MLSKQFGFGAILQISLSIALICKVIDADFEQRCNHKWNVISCLLNGRLLLMAEISSCSIRLTSSM
ncbi:MAG: hypothetical protein RLZZ574_1087 [Cyanobacteriota bacterium]